ncbi:hypothetical protein [Lysobacter silvisoli]|uniref:Uncharacterized protein n=1 Tax=Lysobacter silvisoli TaxID=2293254 RepID=A0A371JXH4_9GAMM|nr:hypothetical protein [Lysobacter silvisoli]RDZ26363.1 hypothetical protein DX914_15260 [Lysobacter silvisoli]
MHKILLGAAIALLGLGMSSSANAWPPPTYPCNASNQGAQTATPFGSGYIVWECDGQNWQFMLQYVCDSQGNNCIPL